jgi:hypothetical protein
MMVGGTLVAGPDPGLKANAMAVVGWLPHF